MVAMVADARLEIRLSAETKARLAYAASLADQPVSDFARSAIEAHIEQMLERHLAVTRIPAEFFDQLIASLDEPDEPNPRLVDAARWARERVKRT